MVERVGFLWDFGFVDGVYAGTSEGYAAARTAPDTGASGLGMPTPAAGHVSHCEVLID